MTSGLFPSELSALREQSGWTQRQLASRIGASTSSLCRWERGESTPKRDHVERLDEILGSGGNLLRVWQSYTSGSPLPPWMRNTGRLQEEAASIEFISPVLVPGILQSPEYARIVFREGQPLYSSREIESLVAVRCERYEVLRSRNDPWITAVFPQSALSAFPDRVRCEQAKHLLNVSETGRVAIHVVPEGTLLVGVTSPLFVVRLQSGGTAMSSDHLTGNFVHDDESWERLAELVKRAFAAALPIEQSRKILEELTA